MAPVLLMAYVRLARREEATLEARFGDAYQRYRAAVPAFFPRIHPASRTSSTPRVEGLAARDEAVTPHR
jgi:hypothetical protein